jgi:fatty-acyl-CoA synthase
VHHNARILNFWAEMAKHSDQHLTFDQSQQDRVCAYFHTGGTTGLPKVAQHKFSGLQYNGWVAAQTMIGPEDVTLCPLPLFHVFAAYPVMMTAVHSGSHVVFPTPQGYRGDGVFDNFWKLVERWQATFIITVPTALSALMQRPVNADISSLRNGFSGSAALPRELFKRFEEATGVAIVEGYGLTESTCLVSANPPDGVKKVGSVGIPFPYCDVKILHRNPDGTVSRECGVDEVGEICVSNPGVWPGNTYTEAAKNKDLYDHEIYLRTGDLGRIDADGYLWITGRAKDLIIRGGHNIDPAMIEEALLSHPKVAFAGAIGQPDAVAGELPCAYVELIEGASATWRELLDHIDDRIPERAAIPKHIETMAELPKTAVGKVFKPDLRRMAITRVFNATFEKAGLHASVAEVVEDKKRGLVAKIARGAEGEDDRIRDLLGDFTVQWDFA